jgi:hypothetical protein
MFCCVLMRCDVCFVQRMFGVDGGSERERELVMVWYPSV